jgi:hypothetical protein
LSHPQFFQEEHRQYHEHYQLQEQQHLQHSQQRQQQPQLSASVIETADGNRRQSAAAEAAADVLAWSRRAQQQEVSRSPYHFSALSILGYIDFNFIKSLYSVVVSIIKHFYYSYTGFAMNMRRNIIFRL